MTPERQKLVLDLVEAKRKVDFAWQAYHAAKEAFEELQDRYIKETSNGGATPPENVICGTVLIQPNEKWDRQYEDRRLDFIEGERCPTSE